MWYNISNMISKINKTILIKRLKSFLWRAGTGVVVGSMAWLLDNIELFEIGAMEVIVSGILVLVIGEVTKYLNT